VHQPELQRHHQSPEFSGRRSEIHTLLIANIHFPRKCLCSEVSGHVCDGAKDNCTRAERSSASFVNQDQQTRPKIHSSRAFRFL
jgi:hypothetical protein